MLAATACGAKPTPPPAMPVPVAPAPAVADVVAPVPMVRTPPPRRLIEAPHAGAIVMLATTDDGKAAVSTDEAGGARLWPTLDGAHEPRVIDLPRPRQLAIGARGTGFAIAALDEVGGLVVADVDGDGLTRSRATLPADPPFLGIAMTDRGALAWRSDQVLMTVAPDGTIASQLAAEPGQRVIGLSVVNGRAIVAIETAGSPAPRARWLAVSPKLAWGGWIATREDVGAAIALAPSGKRFATLLAAKDKQPAKLVVIEVATGKASTTTNVGEVSGVGFTDDEHVVIAGGNQLQWVEPSATKTTSQQMLGGSRPMLLGTGGGRAIGAMDGQLVVATPTSVQYLGYDLQTPSVAAAGAKGQLMIGVNDAFALLDPQLRAVATPDLAMPAGSSASELSWLGGDAWIVERANISDGTTSLAIVDLARGTSSVVRSNMKVRHLVMHEPSTQLFTLSLGEAPEVDRFDPAHQRLDKIAVLPKPKLYEQTELVPVSPQLAGGTELVAIHMRDQLRLQWLRDPKRIDTDAGSVTVCCTLAGIDLAGHVYVWQTAANGPLELAIYRDGKRLGNLPVEGPIAVWPEPSGASILEVGQRTVSLYGSDGAKKWTQAVIGTNEALWLADGAIALVTRTGLARLDAATGAVTAARCGWRFGLSAKPHPLNAREEPVCTAQP